MSHDLRFGLHLDQLVVRWSAPGRVDQRRPPSIDADRDEITVTITIESPKPAGDPSEIDVSEVTIGRIAGFHDDTRERRMAIAREAEHRFERKVSWAVACGDRTELSTNVAAPVMTRLRQPERPAPTR